MSNELIAVLTELRDEQRASRELLERIACALEQSRAHNRLSASDQAAARALLPVIAAATYGRTFTMLELWRHAELGIAPAVVALREALATTDPRKLGRLLRRLSDCGDEAYEITAAETTRLGVRWRVVERGDRSPHHRKVRVSRAGAV